LVDRDGHRRFSIGAAEITEEESQTMADGVRIAPAGPMHKTHVLVDPENRRNLRDRR
jgi:hypothetical protein